MIFEFKNEIYKRIRFDLEKVKPVNTLSFVPARDKDNTNLTLIEAVFFSHSTCFWLDFFREYDWKPYEINLSLEEVIKIFGDLALNCPRYVSEYDDIEVIVVDQNLEDFIKEKLIYDKKRK